MQLSIFSIAAFFATAVMAAPTPTNETVIFSEALVPAVLPFKVSEFDTAVPAQVGQLHTSGVKSIVSVLMCTDANFSGNCRNFLSATGVCLTFPSNLYLIFNDRVSSIYTDPSPCSFYMDAGCNGIALGGVRYNADLFWDGRGLNDKFTSWRC